MNDKIKAILEQIEQTGSITAAAEKLFISQPYVSKVLKQTEEQLQVPLIDRKTKPVVLTYAGKIYLNGLKDLDLHVERLDQQMKRISEEKSGQITIGMSESMSQWILPQLAKKFLKQFPEFNLNVVEQASKDIEASVIQNQIDVYIGMIADYNHRFVYRKMKPVQFAVFNQQTYQPINQPEQLSILNNSPYIQLDKSMVLGEIIDNFLTTNQIRPHTVITVKNIYTALKLAQNGLGYAILPTDIINKDLPSSYISPNLLQNNIIMGHRQQRENTPEMMAFLKSAQEYFMIDPDKQTIYDD